MVRPTAQFEVTLLKPISCACCEEHQALDAAGPCILERAHKEAEHKGKEKRNRTRFQSVAHWTGSTVQLFEYHERHWAPDAASLCIHALAHKVASRSGLGGSFLIAPPGFHFSQRYVKVQRYECAIAKLGVTGDAVWTCTGKCLCLDRGARRLHTSPAQHSQVENPLCPSLGTRDPHRMLPAVQRKQGCKLRWLNEETYCFKYVVQEKRTTGFKRITGTTIQYR